MTYDTVQSVRARFCVDCLKMYEFTPRLKGWACEHVGGHRWKPCCKRDKINEFIKGVTHATNSIHGTR